MLTMVFSQGRGLSEKSHSRADLEADHQIRGHAFRLTGHGKDLKQMWQAAWL